MKTEDISGFPLTWPVEPATIDEIVVVYKQERWTIMSNILLEIHKIRYCIGKTIF